MITLHPTLGVNPHLTFCRRCGGEASELMLIGNRTWILECNQCKAHIIGHRQSEPCPQCKTRNNFTRVGSVGERDKLPAHDVCDKCKKELAEHQAIVAAGGIYFRCLECRAEGVVKAGTLCAKLVRKQMKIPAPEPCGVEFEKCIQHGGKA